MGDRLIDDGVGFWPVLIFAQDLEGLDVENGDVVVAAVAGETFAEVVGDGDAVDALGVGDGADEFVGGGVDDFGLRGVRHVEAMVGAIEIGVIPAGGASDFDLVDHFISGGRGEGERSRGDEEELSHGNENSPAN